MWKPLEFADAVRKQWGAIVTSGVLIGVLEIWQGLGHLVPRNVYWVVALAAFLVASYKVWLLENKKYENENAKNEAAPDILVELPRIIIKGQLGSKTIDLFLNTILTLRNPRKVLLGSFELIGVHDGIDNVASVVDDVDQWERMLRDERTGYKHLRLKTLPKELWQRGNPVEGWLHFVIASSEADLYDSTLQLKVNSAHGTCIGEIAGGHAFPNREKGVIRRVVSYSQSL